MTNDTPATKSVLFPHARMSKRDRVIGLTVIVCLPRGGLGTRRTGHVLRQRKSCLL